MSIEALMRVISTKIGGGISQIIQALYLSSEILLKEGNFTSEINYAIAQLILKNLGFIFENFSILIDNLHDDFETILKTLINLTNNSSLEIVNNAVKYQEELFFLFWEPEEVKQKFPEELVSKFSLIIKDSKKIFFANENIYFQSKLNSILHENPYQPYNIRNKESRRRF